MASDSDKILTLEQAKVELDLPDGSKDRDVRVASAIAQAIGFVSRKNGLPLVDEERRYRLQRLSERRAAIIMQKGWPQPISLVTLLYRESIDSAVTEVNAHTQDIEFDFENQLWVIRPAVFQLDNFGRDWYDPNIIVRVGEKEPVRPEIRAAVIVAMRAIMMDEIPASETEYLLT